MEAASRRYEEKDIDPSILRLLSPGSSLGGARPKANVRHPDGTLWMAKFLTRHDDVDTGALEYAVNRLAALCGLDVPEAVSCRLSDGGATFMARRFDRTESGGRVHFASAMTKFLSPSKPASSPKKRGALQGRENWRYGACRISFFIIQ